MPTCWNVDNQWSLHAKRDFERINILQRESEIKQNAAIRRASLKQNRSEKVMMLLELTASAVKQSRSRCAEIPTVDVHYNLNFIMTSRIIKN